MRVDRLSPVQRSQLMARIRSKDTKPEWVVRRLVHGMGYRYVLHDRRLPGTPDLVFPSRRRIIFVHGCFWHGHDCGRVFLPKTNSEFWSEKISRNRSRDETQLAELRKLGWKVLTVWECSTNPKALASLQRRLERFLGP